MATANFLAWAGKYYSAKVVAIKLVAKKISDSSTIILRLATRGGEWDGNYTWHGVIYGIPSIKRNISEITMGHSMVDYGDIKISYERDGIAHPGITWDQISSEYVLEGQEVEVLLGGPELAWADWNTIFTGLVDEATWSDRYISLTLISDQAASVGKSMPPNTYGNDNWTPWGASTSVYLGELRSPTSTTGHYYEATTAGTTGATEPVWPTTDGNTVADGTAIWTCRTIPEDLEGSVIPLTYGQVSNAPPILIDEASHLYQVHDPSLGPIQAISSVYVGGYLNTANTINLNNCTVRMDAAPESDLTVDIQGGKNSSGSYVYRPAEIVQAILEDVGGVSPSKIGGSFSDHLSDMPYTVGIYIDRSSTVKSIIDDLLLGLLTAWGTDRDGSWYMRLLKIPSSPSDFDVDDLFILDGEAPFERTTAKPLLKKITISYDHNESTNDDPNSAVSESRREWLAEEYRQVVLEEASVASFFGDGATEEGPHETCIVNRSDAEDLAQKWIDLFGRISYQVNFQMKIKPIAYDMLSVVKITRDRMGMGSGIYAAVTNFDENMTESTVRVSAWF